VLFPLVAGIGALLLLELAGTLWYRFAVPEDRRAIVETALGLRSSGFNSVLRYRPHPYFNFAGNPDYRSAAGLQPHGDLGFRPTTVDLTRKRSGALRVVALGGSTTYGMYFDEGRNVWPELVGLGLCETLARDVEVINAGVPNYTTFELLGLASMWLPEFDADIVLVHSGLNDAFAVGFPDEGGPDNTSFRHAWSWRPLPRTARRAMRASRLLRLLGMSWLARGGYHVGDMSRAMQYPVPDEEGLTENLAGASGRYFRRNLETLVVLIRHAGAEPVLVTMPLNPDYEQGLGPYYDAVSRAVVRNNGLAAEVAASHGVPLIELYERMRDPAVYMDAAHLNVQGMMSKAQLVYEDVLPVAERVAGGLAD
jgi:hypothetical protein